MKLIKRVRILFSLLWVLCEKYKYSKTLVEELLKGLRACEANCVSSFAKGVVEKIVIYKLMNSI